MSARLVSNTRIHPAGLPGQIGTVGGFFKMDDSADIYGITNFHVVQRNGVVQVDEEIVQCGTELRIGKLEYWFGLNEGDDLNYFDLAFFKVNTSVVIPSWNISISGFADAVAASSVQIINGNNTVRSGACNGVEKGPFEIRIGTKTYNFTNLLKITSSDFNSDFSFPGESGSVIMSGDQIIAVLIGASVDDPTTSYAMPFLDSLKGKGIRNCRYLDFNI